MTVIPLPAYIPDFQKMESQPGKAAALATELRAVTVSVKDVQGWAEGIAAPAWEGDTGAAHDHAATRFATRLDAAEAALDRVVAAADRFEERLVALRRERLTVSDARSSVNADRETLRTDIDAVGDAATPEQVEALERRGERLLSRAEDVNEDIRGWTIRYDAAESAFVAALAGVDSLSEGRGAAQDPVRVDVDALTRQLTGRKGDPKALAAWWASLTPAQRQALKTEHPQLVGNADGLPVTDRDEANRAALGSDIDYLEQRRADGELTGAEKRILENAHYVDTSLDKYQDNLDPVTGEELTHLIVYKPGIHSGDGGVAISFGNPDTADHVSVNVPGLTSETSSTEGNLDKTWALHQAALDERSGTVASVYWLDYDAPSGNPVNPLDPLGALDFDGVALPVKADEGGERFADFIDGLHASDQGPAAHVTAIGHSYGSTAVGHALQDGMKVDDAILIGSPGQPVSTAAGLTGADVWVGSKDYDPVSLLGRGDRGGLGALGYDPADKDFGATRFATGDGSLRVQDLLKNHTSYFKDESLANMAHVVTDNDDRVTEQPHRGDPGGGYYTLEELVTVSTAASGGELVWDHGGEWLYERGKDGVEIAGDVGGFLLDHSSLGGILGR